MDSELQEHFETIDAAVFSGDSFLIESTNREAQQYVDRWNRELARHRETIAMLKREKTRHYMHAFQREMLANNTRRTRDR